jgi:hypothetical protein
VPQCAAMLETRTIPDPLHAMSYRDRLCASGDRTAFAGSEALSQRYTTFRVRSTIQTGPKV